MRKIVFLVLKVFFTAVLASVLTRWIITSGLADAVLDTEIGGRIYRRMIQSLGIIGGESAEDLLIIVVLGVTLVLSSGVMPARPR